MKVCGLEFTCNDERLVVETQQIAFEQKMHDLVSNIFLKLPHTPLIACGLNSMAHYEVEDESYYHKIGHSLVPKDTIWNDIFPASAKPGMRTVSVQGSREGEYPGVLICTVQPSSKCKQGVFIHTNFDYRAREEGSLSAMDLRTFVDVYWPEAAAEPHRVAEQIFKNISPDPHE